MAAEESVTMVVQVNGKVRDRIAVRPSIDEAEMERLALESPKVREVIDGHKPKRVIAKPPKLLNLVV
jgi:leucyl-tRNA synthetase